VHIRINIPNWGWREIGLGLAALASVGRSRSYRKRLLGELERELAGRKPVLVSSARFGLTLAARLLGLEGRRVAIPGYVCPAVLTGLRAAAVETVPIDCSPASTRFDPVALSVVVADQSVDAILASNTYGLDQDFRMLAQLGLPVIEDAAYQAGRSDRDGKMCGARGDVGVWSFNFKALTAVGGGVLLLPDGTDEPECARGSLDLKQTIRFFNYAVRSRGRHLIPESFAGARPPVAGPDLTVRSVWLELDLTAMSEIQAAVALAQWESRNESYARQRFNSNCIAEAITRSDAFTTIAGLGDSSLPHLFPVLARVSDKDAPSAVYLARRFLHSRGVQTETPYPVLLGPRDVLPNAHTLAARLVLVPCNASLGERQIRRVAAALEAASREVARQYNVAEVCLGR
jgi:dTDP-4-amino-4,6-dideoxygalactose transaminase